MADEEVEDGNDQEMTSPTGSKNGSLEEYRSKSSTIESVPEETSDKIEDGSILNVTDLEKSNDEIKKTEKEAQEEDEKTIESSEKIERPSKASKDASEEKSTTSMCKLTDVDDEEGQASMKKKKSEMQQVQKGRRLQCGRQFRRIIGKQELRKEELEKREGDLRQRLDVLECSMPAVMVWNVWQRMSQGGPIPNLHRLMEKQFRAPAAGEVCCPSTPSQHYDCRVREVEADRKEAQRRLEEARELWLEKESRLKERREKLEEAKRIQEERKEKIERLTKEANELREALKKMDEEATAEEEQMMSGACESGECGDIRCRDGWLRRAGSVDSIKTIDVECLARLRELAESELTMKKQIAELERREETYMRTLQHADEMWSKMEGDTGDTDLQEQLNAKTNANQQLASRICELEDDLERLRTRMALCRSELTKYTSIEKIEAIIGGEDDFAETADRMVGIQPKVAGKVVGGEDDLAEVLDKEVLTKDELEDKETLAKIDVEDKEVSPDQIILATGKSPIGPPIGPTTGLPIGEPMEPEKIDEMHKYLAMLGSLEELYYDDDYGVCGPEYACYEDGWHGTYEGFSATDFSSTPVISEKVFSVSQEDVEAVVSRDTADTVPTTEGVEERVDSGEVDARVSSKFDEGSVEEYEGPEGMQEQMGIPLEDYEGVEEPEEAHEAVKDEESFEEFKHLEDDIPVEVGIDEDTVTVPLNKLRSWLDTVDSIRLVISECPTCSAVKDDVDTLAEDIATYAEVKAKEAITEIMPTLDTIEAEDEEGAMEEVVPDSEMMDEEEAITEFATELEDGIETIPKVEDVVEERSVTSVEVELVIEPAVEPVIEPDVEADIESVTEPIVEPAVEPAVEPDAESDGESDAESIVIPVVEEIVEQVVEPVVESTVEPISEQEVESVSPIPDEVTPEEATPEIKEPKEVIEEEESESKEIITELPGEVPEEKIKRETSLEQDIATEEETKIIVPVEKLSDEEDAPLVKEEAPTIEVKEEVEDTMMDDEHPFDEGAVEERLESQTDVDEIEVEKVVAIETEDMAGDITDEIVEITIEETEEIEDVSIKKEISKELESEVVSELDEEAASAVTVEEPTEKIEAAVIPSTDEIFVDAETEEVAVPPAVPSEEISETIEFKVEIPSEEEEEEEEEEKVKLIEPETVPLEEKIEEVKEKVSLLDEDLIEIEEIGEIKEEELMEKEMPILVEPEIEDIKEVVEIVPEEFEVRESPLSIPEEKPEIKKERRIPIDPQIVATPYLAVADVEEITEEPPDVKKVPCVCKQVAETAVPPTLPAMQIVITQTENVQTVVNRGTQTWTVQITPIKVPGQRSIETDTRDPEISARKMRWRMRPKNRSAIPCSNVSSQTEKPSLVLRTVTQDPGPSEKQRLLSSILESLKSSQSTEEKELRSINYGQKQHGITKCDCCVCEKEKLSSCTARQFSKYPRTMRLPKSDKIVQDSKLKCETLKSGSREKQQTSLLSTGSVSKSGRDRGICTCALPALRSKLRTSSGKMSRSEKRDQSCLAKLSKSKVRSPERRKDERYGAVPCGGKCTKDGASMGGIIQARREEAVDSPSNCMCNKTEKTPSGRLWKRQICACGDSD